MLFQFVEVFNQIEKISQDCAAMQADIEVGGRINYGRLNEVGRRLLQVFPHLQSNVS